MEMRLKLAKTAAGKNKIVDNNGFSIATAPDATKYSQLHTERLVLSYNILSQFDMEYLREMSIINFKDFTSR